MKKVLECSTAGDQDFSALCASVDVFGKWDTIENHYQLSKLFKSGDGRFRKPASWRDAKGKTPYKVQIGPYRLEPRFLTQWYKLLWLKYLDANPDLVTYAKQFDEFTDKFRSKKSQNCQADVIRQYVKEGRLSLLKECGELLALLRVAQEQEKAKKSDTALQYGYISEMD